MRTVSSPIRFATGAMRSSNVVAVGEVDHLGPPPRQPRGVGGEGRRARRGRGRGRACSARGAPSLNAPSLRLAVCGAGRCSRSVRLAAGCDPPGDERRVVVDQAEQRRAACVLPGEAEEVEARHVADAAAVAQTTVVLGDRQLDPGVVGPVARGPDHRVDVELAAVGEADRAALGVDRARPSSTPCRAARRAGSTRSGCRGRALGAEARVDGLVEQARASSATRRGRGRGGAAAAASGASRPPDEPRASPASSFAIWKPVLPPPTTSTRALGQVAGRR